MTQTDQNTPATATTSKRTTKAKTTTAKAAADTKVLAPVETEQTPSLDAAVNQEKTSSQAELQEMQSDTADQSPVADVEPEQATDKEADAVNQMFLSVNMEGMPEVQREAYKHELEGILSDTAGQNLVADVEPEQTTDKEADAVNQMFLSVNMEGMPEVQREAYKHELEGILSDTAGQNLVADVEPEQATAKEVDAIQSDSEPENSNQENPVNEAAGTEPVAFWDQSAQYHSAAAAVQVAEKNDGVRNGEASGVELINEVLPEVQSPLPVKQSTVVKSGLFVVVKNTGVQTVFEPLSKTSIKSGEMVEIRCSNGQFKHDVLNNLKQFIGLGKNLEIQNA